MNKWVETRWPWSWRRRRRRLDQVTRAPLQSSKPHQVAQEEEEEATAEKEEAKKHNDKRRKKKTKKQKMKTSGKLAPNQPDTK